MKRKRATFKLILLLLCLIIYTATDLYNKVNIFILILLAAIVGFAIHYIVEFIFNQIKKDKKKNH